MPILNVVAPTGRPKIYNDLRYVISHGGPGPFRQYAEIRRLMRRGLICNETDYYQFGFWRDGYDDARIAEFVPRGRRRAFNRATRIEGSRGSPAPTSDKIATENFLKSHGFPVAETLAVFQTGAAETHGLPHLPDADALANWLAAEPARYPLFGKPRAGLRAMGTVLFAGLCADGRALRLGDGSVHSITAICDEILRDWPGGYLFQKVLRNAASFRMHTPLAAATTRMVTLRSGDGVRLWYAVQRLPAPGAMHDNNSRAARAQALIDRETGRIVIARLQADPAAAPLTHWIDPDEPLIGKELEHFAAARELVCKAHLLYPDHGMIGWDVVLTDEGPVISEPNSDPAAAVYQLAAQDGLKSARMRPDYERTLAWCAAERVRLGLPAAGG